MTRSTDGVRLCKDCGYARPFMFFNYDLAHCFNPNLGQRRTDGAINSTFCSIVRDYRGCGSHGEWFEERKPIWLRVIQAAIP